MDKIKSSCPSLAEFADDVKLVGKVIISDECKVIQNYIEHIDGQKKANVV